MQNTSSGAASGASSSGATGGTSNGGKVMIIGAIITAVAGIITAIVTMSGPLINNQIAISATQTREAVMEAPTRTSVAATAAAVAAEAAGAGAAGAETAGVNTPAANGSAATPTPGDSAAAVVEPTRTEKPPLALLPTKTPALASNPAKASDSPAGTVLKVGEGYTAANGIVVKLTDIEVPAGDEIHLHFTFTNPTSKVMKLSLDHNQNVTLTDDKGNVYTWATQFTWEVTIYPGTSRNDEVKRRGDVSRAGYFVVKLDIPGMMTAQWKK